MVKKVQAAPAEPVKPRTLFDKIWDSHVVHRQDDGTCVLYVDRHLVHEVTSPQAFEGLRATGRKVRRPDATATTHATAQVDTVDAFGLLLDRVVELISWRGPGLDSKHSPPGPERAMQWIAGYDGAPLPGTT